MQVYFPQLLSFTNTILTCQQICKLKLLSYYQSQTNAKETLTAPKTKHASQTNVLTHAKRSYVVIEPLVRSNLIEPFAFVQLACKAIHQFLVKKSAVDPIRIVKTENAATFQLKNVYLSVHLVHALKALLAVLEIIKKFALVIILLKETVTLAAKSQVSFFEI